MSLDSKASDPSTPKSAQLIEGPVGKTLLDLTVPMIWGILAIMLFNIVDTFYIGQLGATELAAVSFTFPVVYVILSVSIGMGIGASAVISRAIGEGDHFKVQRLATDSLALASIVVIGVAVVGFLTIDPIFNAIGATPEMLPLIREYMEIWYIGIGFVVIPIVGNSAIRATGDTKTPSKIMWVAGGVNVILDPFLIFGIGPFPRMELAGAALATVIAYMVTLFASLWVLGKREHMLTFKRPTCAQVFHSWKQIAYIGLPAAGTNVLTPISTAILTKMVAAYGPQAVAAFGVGTRIESLGMVGVMAMSSVMTPFVGQNWGAKLCGRVKEAIRFSFKSSLLWGLGVYCTLLAGGPYLARAFTEDPQIITLTLHYLWIVPLSYGLFGVALLVNSTYNGLHRPLRSTALIAIRLFFLAIPLAYVGSWFWGIEGLFAGIALGNLTIGLIAYSWVRKYIATEEPKILADRVKYVAG